MMIQRSRFLSRGFALHFLQNFTKIPTEVARGRFNDCQMGRIKGKKSVFRMEMQRSSRPRFKVPSKACGWQESPVGVRFFEFEKLRLREPCFSARTRSTTIADRVFRITVENISWVNSESSREVGSARRVRPSVESWVYLSFERLGKLIKLKINRVPNAYESMPRNGARNRHFLQNNPRITVALLFVSIGDEYFSKIVCVGMVEYNLRIFEEG